MPIHENLILIYIFKMIEKQLLLELLTTKKLN